MRDKRNAFPVKAWAKAAADQWSPHRMTDLPASSEIKIATDHQSRATPFGDPDWNRHCGVVIPCHNESSAIAQVVQEAKVHLNKVLVIDDGSTDDTGRIAFQAGAEVLRNERNEGKGAALKRGFARLRELGFTWALTLDGDLQLDPAEIPLFLHHSELTGASLVIGNRMSKPGKMPPLRRFVNRWMSRRLSRKAGLQLPDSQCGFRLLKLEVADQLTLKTNHFETESEMVLGFAELKARIGFVEIQSIYAAGGSKIHPVLDTWRWVRWWTGFPGKSGV